MIKNVGTVSVFVSDQQRAKAFYTDVLDLELRRDEPLYPGSPHRWIAVAPPGAETEIILYLPDENWDHYQQVVGETQAITLTVTDIKTLFEALTQKGVNFVQEPEVQPWGTFALIADSEGNRLLLVEH
jgi:predicted enzyme related to lactoylglutathione lyase